MPPSGENGRDPAPGLVHWELAMAAAGLGSFDWDLVTGRLTWDERLIELFGYVRDGFDETIEAFNQRLHPDDRARVALALETAIATCGEYGAEYRVVHPDGSVHWIEARGRALAGADGIAVRVVGVGYDTTAVREGEARFTRVVESMPSGYFVLDDDWRFRYMNAEAERVLHRSRGELLGVRIWDAYPATLGTDFERAYRQAVAGGEPVTLRAYYPEPLNRWWDLRAVPGPDGLSVFFLDITTLMEALDTAERAARTDGLLARVASELTQTLSARDAAVRMSEVVVPAVADWCVISIIDDELPGRPWERLRDVGWAHAEPVAAAALGRSAGLMSRSFQEVPELARVLETGRPLFLSHDATELIAGVLLPGETLELLRVLAPAAVEFIPLVVNDRVLGTMVTGHVRSASPAAGHSDRDVILQIAARAAVAFDNARAYQAERRMAAGLQRALFTRPPQPDHCEIVVRYEPAAEAAQVGGDWYDAFVQEDGATVLVIGDVVGHDVEAAAAMGQLRGLLRGIAATTGAGPAEVLRRLDAAMRLLQIETTATAVVARLEQTPDELRAGVSRMRWSSAGHPPPLVLQPDGSVAVLGVTTVADGVLQHGGEADLLLGMDADTPRTEAEVVLQRGSTVLLFTDGLVERRDQSVDDGLVRLRRLLGGATHRSLDELCDAVLVGMLDARPDDDVAIAAVRLHRQDR